MTAPTMCCYCDGDGNSDAGGACGFCVRGKPLDTQADWDASWGRIARLDAVRSAPPDPESETP